MKDAALPPLTKADLDIGSGPTLKDASDAIAEAGKKNWGPRGLSPYEVTVPPAHTEQIMRELKAGGYYMSRDISRAGVEFNIVDTKPVPEMIARFDKRVELYRDIHKAFAEFGTYNEGPKKFAATMGLNGKFQADAKRALFDMRLPGILNEIDTALANGEQVVFSVVSVGEVSGDKGGHLGSAIDLINAHKVEKIGGGKGQDVSYSDPEEIPEALIRKAELWERLRELDPLPAPQDILREKYGDKFEFITGAVKSDDRTNAAKAFQNNLIDVLMISGAGKTGINLHDITGKRRVHLIEGDYEWSAKTFKQGLGRVDRTGQRQAPKITIMHNGSAAEKKFVSTIANRLRGLGATSKGASESTGTGALTTDFELGSAVDLIALSNTWRKLPYELKDQFLDNAFKDKTVDMPKPDLDGTTANLKKFLLAMQTLYFDDANKVYEIFSSEIDALANSDAAMADEAAKAAKTSGKVLRETQLTDNLRMTEVTNQDGETFAIIDGILTPNMVRVRNALTAGRSVDDFLQAGRDGRGWMRWTTFQDTDTGNYISGLVIKKGKVKSVGEAFGHRVLASYTPEMVLTDLAAGDKIPIHGSQGAEWELYTGSGGSRAGKIVVSGAKMKDLKTLLANGAKYQDTGSFFWVAHEDVQEFLKRFPIRDTGLTPGEGEPKTLYQTLPDGRVEPTEEAGRQAQEAVPGGPAVMRINPPFEFAGMRIAGMVFMDGKFIAYVPQNFAALRDFAAGQGKANLLGIAPDGKRWVFRNAEGDVEYYSRETDNPSVAGPLAMGTLDSVAGTEYDSQVLEEGWANYVRPIMDELMRVMTNGEVPVFEGNLGEKLNQLAPQDRTEVIKYLNQAKQEMSGAKLAAIRQGESKRDQSLLNYSRRYKFDNYSQLIFPYNFWYTRSGMNWATRILDRPALLAFYSRLQNFRGQNREDETMPSRLDGKVRIPAALPT